MDDQQLFAQKLQERFAQLPKVVQDAITSADVEKQLRALAETHKLHIDQWAALENEVMLALLGFQPAQDLAKNIAAEVGLPADAAQALAADISKVVFEPVRGELERNLEHPEAKAEAKTGAEQVRDQVLAAEGGTPPAAPAVAPAQNAAATAPSAAAAEAAAPAKPAVERTPVAESYKPGESSAARAAVHDDPYREPPV